MTVIGIFTEDGLDQTAETRTIANREKRDLVAMGCTVNLYEATDESTLDAIHDWIRDGRSFAVARARVEAGQFLNAPATDALAPRSLSAAATPCELANGYDAPAPDPTAAAFRDWTRAQCAIDESLELYSDICDPFDSVLAFVGYPEARETTAYRGAF